MSVTPYHRIRVLTGTKSAKVIEDPAEYARLIRKAKRPLLVLGPRAALGSIDGKPLVDYALEIAKIVNVPICATSQAKAKLVERGVKPECAYEVVEIINALRHPDWKGVRKEGNHDLVIFFGIRCDIAEQGLSVLKHFAPHLKTITLCRFYHPNADYGHPIFVRKKELQWKVFLDELIDNLKKGA
jgi:acetyl-CoA decarbonylase/synthase complex subunit epsilon